MRFFNTAGPVNPADHYCLDPLQRIELNTVLPLIEQKKYFVLHAPRQTGKTSCLLALRDYLNAGDRYRCVYVNVEGAQSARENVADAMRAIVHASQRQGGRILGTAIADLNVSQILAEAGPHDGLQTLLNAWSQASSHPLVLLLDEVDALVGDTLIAVLRQIRAGYTDQPRWIPANGDSMRGAGRAGLPDSFHGGQGDHHRRERVQHQSQVAAIGQFHGGGDGCAVRRTHRRNGPGVHRGGAGMRLDAQPGSTVVGQCPSL